MNLKLKLFCFIFIPQTKVQRVYEYLKVSVAFELCEVMNPSSRMFQTLLKVIIVY